MRFRDGLDGESPGIVCSDDHARELREDGEEEAANAEMMREVAKMVLQPTAEIVRVPICCERVVLLKSLDCIGKVVACVTLRASDLHDDPLYLAIAPPSKGGVFGKKTSYLTSSSSSRVSETKDESVFGFVPFFVIAYDSPRPSAFCFVADRPLMLLSRFVKLREPTWARARKATSVPSPGRAAMRKGRHAKSRDWAIRSKSCQAHDSENMPDSTCSSCIPGSCHESSRRAPA